MGGILGRTFNIISWLLIGRLDDSQKAKILSFLEVAKNDAKGIEIVANKKGELTLRYKKEF